MLHEPYGWGGMYGEQDCSAFLVEVFATVGIMLPRDSIDQAKAGQERFVFDAQSGLAQKQEALSGLSGGLFLLPMKGHILLYLGMEQGQPYAIHCVWAYRERKGERDIPRVINRVAVTGLSLGDKSSRGSFLKRLISIVAIQ